MQCTDYRDEVIDLIKRLYKDKLKKNLPIFAPTLTNLGNFCTTQEEANKGLTRMPKRETALEEENIIQEQSADEESKEEDNVILFCLMSRILYLLKTLKECQIELIPNLLRGNNF